VCIGVEHYDGEAKNIGSVCVSKRSLLVTLGAILIILGGKQLQDARNLLRLTRQTEALEKAAEPDVDGEAHLTSEESM
jgi:hypothetical protein